jgi:hypothetical protein
MTETKLESVEGRVESASVVVVLPEELVVETSYNVSESSEVL